MCDVSTQVRHELESDSDQTKVRLGGPNSSVSEHGRSVDSAKPTQSCCVFYSTRVAECAQTVPFIFMLIKIASDLSINCTSMNTIFSY